MDIAGQRTQLADQCTDILPLIVGWDNHENYFGHYVLFGHASCYIGRLRCIRIHNQVIIRKFSFVVKLPTSNPSEPAPPQLDAEVGAELEAASLVAQIPERIRLDRLDRQIALVLAAV